MNDTFYILGALMLFLLGLRLSAFFSGVETGFYRASFLRVNIDAQAGDRIASRLLWFLQNPSYFVATCLVGNNVANYVTTLAVGLFVGRLFPGSSGWGEIASTLAVAPVVFISGELLPKNLYFRAPMKLLRKDSKLFQIFYRIFLPVSFPLIGVAKIFERYAQGGERHAGLVLGRNRLAQVLSQGHREGILLDVQNRMVTGLMKLAQEKVTAGMTPAVRMIGVIETASREEILKVAREFGTPYVIIRSSEDPESVFGYLRTADVLLTRGPLKSLIQTMPRFTSKENRLEALLVLRENDSRIGIVEMDGKIQGVVYEQGLIEAFLRA